MDFLPLFLRLTGRPALVVGGGEVAARKVALLLDAGAEVRVVAPELGTTLAGEHAAGRIRHVARHFAASDLEGADLAIAATDDVVVNAEVSRLARARSLPVNVVDNPALCSFIMPAIVDRSPVIVALSTGGASPVHANLMAPLVVNIAARRGLQLLLLSAINALVATSLGLLVANVLRSGATPVRVGGVTTLRPNAGIDGVMSLSAAPSVVVSE